MEGESLERYIVTSDDGSHTIKVPQLKEHYHSHKGAIQESEYVFIKMGLETCLSRDCINVLEVGFGTGLNALLTALYPVTSKVSYTTLEPFPVASDLIEQLNYPNLINDVNAPSIFKQIHSKVWGQIHEITSNFSICKLKQPLQQFNSDTKIDLVYFDAFAPHAQPELWEKTVWDNLFDLMNDQGVVVTYCAKGQVRRDLQGAGFLVERLPGPPGKREMIRATKPPK